MGRALFRALVVIGAFCSSVAVADDGANQHCKWIRNVGSCQIGVTHDPDTHEYTVTGQPGICKRATVLLNGSPSDVVQFYGDSIKGGYMVLDKTKPVVPSRGSCVRFESLEEAAARCVPAEQAGIAACNDWVMHNWPCKKDIACARKFYAGRPRACFEKLAEELNSCVGVPIVEVRLAPNGYLWNIYPIGQ